MGVVTATFTSPAAWKGVVAVTDVSLTAVTPVAAMPPKVTEVAPARFVPVMVTPVPPIVWPIDGVILENVGTVP